jgi:probable F420-dependent oxidoreductase
MGFGVHLPLISFAGEQRSLDDLLSFTEAAHDLGYTHLCANDHLVFSRPWLDGPTALAAVLAHSGQMTLATTVAVPVLRGPAATAKTLAAIDLLAGGRLVVGVGPGSSARDYELVGVRFEERWKRLDEAVQTLRAYWRADDVAFEGAFYSTGGVTLAPTPSQRPGPPIWIGSWGSAAGLKRVARLADGWLASGYNTTPELFAQAWSDVQAEVAACGRDVARFPNGIATMWCYVTEDRARADTMLAKQHGRPGSILAVASPGQRTPAQGTPANTLFRRGFRSEGNASLLSGRDREGSCPTPARSRAGQADALRR